jgi:PTH1 family peptidyl-tRNA hydrolase
VVFGIGNPGRRYARTRHNVGFRVVDELALRHGVRLAASREGVSGEGRIEAEPVLLVKPQDYVNRSGLAFGRLLRAGFALADMLVVCDDFHLALGALRIRAAGSAGGHNGIQSILDVVGDGDVPRLRMGIGPVPGGDPADFVLAPFGRDEVPVIQETIERAADAAAMWALHGIEETMGRCNRKGVAPP